MTHGDKKAKTGKTSQASAKKVSKASPSGKARGKVVAASQGKGSGKVVKAVAPAAKTSAATGKAGAGKSIPKAGPSATDAAKESAARVAGSKNGRAAVPAEPFAFSDLAIAAAFKRAVKKYPNAFRRLTD